MRKPFSSGGQASLNTWLLFKDLTYHCAFLSGVYFSNEIRWTSGGQSPNHELYRLLYITLYRLRGGAHHTEEEIEEKERG